MKVSEVMDREFSSITKEETLEEAKSILEEKNTDFLIVEDQNEAIGIVTLHDVLRYFNEDFGQIKVKEAMTPDIVAINQTKNLKEAIKELIKAKIDQIIVFEKNEGEKEVIGFLTIEKILKEI